MKSDLSEAELVTSFLSGFSEPYHPSHRDFLGRHAVEVPMFQGRPDLVLSRTVDVPESRQSSDAISRILRTPKHSSVVGCLSFSRFTNKHSLMAELGVDQPEISRILSELVDQGVAKESQNSFKLTPRLRSQVLVLWAIEFKLNDWKRALYQAIRYRSSAQRVTVVMPSRKKPFSKEIIARYSRYNIGLSFFDPETGQLKTAVRTKTMRPYSMRNYYYGLGHFLGISRAALN